MSESFAIKEGDALIVVDVLNSLLTGDAAVPAGEEVISPLMRVVDTFHSHRLPIYATGITGIECASMLGLPAFAMMISRAPAQTDISSFAGTNLEFQLMMYGVKRLFIGGLGESVAATARDAIRRGHEVVMLHDAVRVHPADEPALADLMELGAVRVSAADVA